HLRVAHLLPQKLEDETRDGFIEFQEDVAHEPIADQNIALVLDDVTPFDVPYEVQAGALEELIGLKGLLVAFLRLLADVEQPDARHVDPHQITSVDRAEVGELEKLGRTGVDVRTSIDEQ